MVITAIREKESLLSKTFNLLIVNLCLSNLASCVMVKSGKREVKMRNIFVSQLAMCYNSYKAKSSSISAQSCSEILKKKLRSVLLLSVRGAPLPQCDGLLLLLQLV